MVAGKSHGGNGKSSHTGRGRKLSIEEIKRIEADIVARTNIENFYKPIFPRWVPARASAANPAAEDTPSEERLQRFSPKKRRRNPPRRGLSPPHQTLLLCSTPESGRRGAPGAPGDGSRTSL